MRVLHANDPIGIFDSGIGGLTVANAIQKILPHEQIIYFGDTVHLPYGDKSATAVRGYASRIADFLIEKKCKTIVIACNTASAVAYHAMKKQVGKRAHVFNVIDPVVKYVAEGYPASKVGVIGTKGTINSRVYVRKLHQCNKEMDVVSMATPLLAPMIEEGFFNNYISRTVIGSYLTKKPFQNIKALILGCTHYPLIKKEVSEHYKHKVEIIDSADVVASYVAFKLGKAQLLSPRKTNPKHRFFVSDYTDAFEQSTRFFFKDEIHLKKANIWK